MKCYWKISEARFYWDHEVLLINKWGTFLFDHEGLLENKWGTFLIRL